MAVRYQYGMPFRAAVGHDTIQDALTERGVSFRSRVFDPATTIWAWMSQIASQDGSCRQAVSDVVAFHSLTGCAVSARTGAYTQARQRLDTGAVQHLARTLARRLESNWQLDSLFGRPLLAVDGTTVSCPDTPSILARYPKQETHYAAEGLGFPILRLVLVVSLTTGAIVDLGISPYRGQGTHEVAIFNRMWPNLHRGDVVVGDRAYSASVFYHWMPRQGVDLVSRKVPQLELDRLRVERTLGRSDHVRWMNRPGTRPAWMPPLAYRRTPSKFPVRATSLWVQGREGMSQLELLSSLTDGSVTKPQLAEAYRLRWDVETDIRSFKVDLGADILRCQTAEMLEKELWMTVLTYNAVRLLMANAARRAGVMPREISFKGALQATNAFAPRLRQTAAHEQQPVLESMYAAMASHLVRNRPGRVEPRAVKRRAKKVERLLVSREEARGRCREQMAD